MSWDRLKDSQQVHHEWHWSKNTYSLSSPSSPSHAGTSSTSAGTRSSTASTSASSNNYSVPIAVPSCWWEWPFGCGASAPVPASSIAVSGEAWEEAEEVLRAESNLRESIAGGTVFSLEEALRWARSVGGVDRELLKIGRQRLPRLRLREKLLQAMKGGDKERLEEVLSEVCSLGLDNEILDQARTQLAALQLDWLPLRTITVEDLKVVDNPSAPVSHRECTICLETYREHDTQAFLPCCHRFHEKCVKKWLARSTDCPVCKHNASHEVVFEEAGLSLVDAGACTCAPQH